MQILAPTDSSRVRLLCRLFCVSELGLLASSRNKSNLETPRVAGCETPSMARASHEGGFAGRGPLAGRRAADEEDASYLRLGKGALARLMNGEQRRAINVSPYICAVLS